jgi:hypothetical protein
MIARLPVIEGQWSDWRWQQKNALRSVDRLLELFPALHAGAHPPRRERSGAARR